MITFDADSVQKPTKRGLPSSNPRGRAIDFYTTPVRPTALSQLWMGLTVLPVRFVGVARKGGDADVFGRRPAQRALIAVELRSWPTLVVEGGCAVCLASGKGYVRGWKKVGSVVRTFGGAQVRRVGTRVCRGVLIKIYRRDDTSHGGPYVMPYRIGRVTTLKRLRRSYLHVKYAPPKRATPARSECTNVWVFRLPARHPLCDSWNSSKLGALPRASHFRSLFHIMRLRTYFAFVCFAFVHSTWVETATTATVYHEYCSGCSTWERTPFGYYEPQP